MTPRALLFDLDGTIIDSDPLHRLTWIEVLKPYDFDVSEEIYRTKFSGRLNLAILDEFLPRVERATRVALSERKEALYRDMAEQLTFIAGVEGVMRRANARGIKQAIVTNGPRLNVDRVLSALNLAGLFDTIVTAGDVPQGKPHPAPYQEALRRFGLAPTDALVFEDSESGVRAGAAAGVHTIGLTTSQPAEVLRAAGAHTIARDFTDPALAKFAI